MHETEGQVILNGSYDIGFTLDLALKDLGLALELGSETGVPLELAELAERAFEQARERYGGSAWSPMVVKLLEDAVGADLRAPGFPGHARPPPSELRPELAGGCGAEGAAFRDVPAAGGIRAAKVPLRGILLAIKAQTASSSSSAYVMPVRRMPRGPGS